MSEKANELKEFEISAERLAFKDTRKYMFDMLLLLTAPAIMAWYYYGSRALWLICICVITSILTESITAAVIKTKSHISDLSSIITAVSIALCMPASVQWWIPCLATIFAIAVVKLPFGDSRSLLFLPSAGGIAFVTICFPEEIFAYPVIPQPVDSLAVFGSENFVSGESITYMLSQGNSIGVNIVNYIDIAVGNVPGPMGTTCAVAMLGGLIYMLFRRPKGAVVSVSFLTACALFAAAFPRVGTSRTISVIMELSGGLLFFSALAFVSNETIAPKRFISRICYGVFGGLTAMLLRRYSPLEESTVFAVLLMNSVSTVFDSKLPVIGLEKKHLIKQLEEAKEEQLRLEKELEEVEKAQREEDELAEISAKIESKRSAMVQSISQSIQSQAIPELEDIPDEIPLDAEDESSAVPDKSKEQAQEEYIDDDIPTLQDIGELATKYELDVLSFDEKSQNGGDSDE